jgi:hypothetical protein
MSIGNKSLRKGGGMKQKIFALYFGIGVIFSNMLLLNCSTEIEDGPSDPWQMKVECDYQVGYALDDYEGLYSNVKGAFNDAGTEVAIFAEGSFLADDPYFFTPDGLLRFARRDTFFNAHKTSGLVYYLASFDGLDINQAKVQLLYWGITSAPPAPNVPPDPKWSYIFVGDIPEEYYGGRWTKHRHVTYATIHELGHQRTGLTHPEEHPEYHHPTYPCIMHTHYNVTSEVLSTMGFCYNTTSGDNCKYFLGLQNQK